MELTAKNLKQALWQALQDVKAGTITPQQGDAIARHSREIVRVHMAQLSTRSQIAAATEEMVSFVESKESENVQD